MVLGLLNFWDLPWLTMMKLLNLAVARSSAADGAILRAFGKRRLTPRDVARRAQGGQAASSCGEENR